MSTMIRAISGPRAAAVALLLGIYAFGLFEIAILPPFEGFDEPGHYSYMQQLAWTGTWPRHGDPMSADVDDYLQVAPTAAAMHPRWSYRDFFAAPAETVAAGRDATGSEPPAPRTWRPGQIPNWEAQHPPLYYALLAPAFRLSAGWSLGAQLFLLRAISYTIAWCGLCLAGVAAIQYAKHRRLPLAPVLLAPALWPLLLPMWYPDMARLGNDSLVALLVAFTCLAVARLDEHNGRRFDHLMVGAVLGLGLLTKATFLPLAAATLIVLSLRAWRDRSTRSLVAGALDVASCAGAILVVAGWWYIGQALSTGSAIGSNDAIALRDTGGLWEGLRQHGSLAAFLRTPKNFFLSIVWSGTWSAISPPLYAVIPLLLALLSIAVATVIPPAHGADGSNRSKVMNAIDSSDMERVGARKLVPAYRYVALRASSLTLLERLAAVTVVLFVVALSYQSVILIAEMGSGAPAWYLHSYAPVLWVLFAIGLAGTTRRRGPRWALAGTIVYGLGFSLLANLVQMLFFSGCGTPKPDSHSYDLASASACLADPAITFGHLDAIAFPTAACLLLALAVLLLGPGSAMAILALQTRASAARSQTA